MTRNSWAMRRLMVEDKVERKARRECEFSKGELVLAKVPTQRFWPARVEKCDKEDEFHADKWFVERTQMLWCVFVDTYESKWVHGSQVKKFTERTIGYSMRRSLPEMKRKLQIAVDKALGKHTENENNSSSSKDQAVDATFCGRDVEAEKRGDDVVMVDTEIQNQDGNNVDTFWEAKELRCAETTSNESADRCRSVKKDGNANYVQESAEHNDYASDEDGIGLKKNAKLHSRRVKQAYPSFPLLDDLVLAKTGRYPYWPAVVSKCMEDETKWKNRWLLFHTDRDSVLVWCSFVGDISGSWVAPRHIRAFDPEFVCTQSPNRNSRLYTLLRESMKEATRMYRTKRRLKIALPTSKRAIFPSYRHDQKPGSVPSGTNERFQLGELVLAQFAPTCPYWPALIQKSSNSQNGPSNCSLEGSDRLYCHFISDESEAWVNASQILQFTPMRARSCLCDTSSTLFKAQQEAINEAITMYETRLES